MEDDKLIKEYNIIAQHIRDVLDDLKNYPNDEFLKSQLKISRQYKKELEIELQLRGLKYGGK